jgi:hypothetical protein
MQFLVEQQARFDARLQSYAVQFQSYVAEFESDMKRINNTLVSVTAIQENTNAILATLAQKHVDLAESHKQGMAELRKTNEETDKRLGALAALIQSHVSKRN